MQTSQQPVHPFQINLEDSQSIAGLGFQQASCSQSIQPTQTQTQNRLDG